MLLHILLFCSLGNLMPYYKIENLPTTLISKTDRYQFDMNLPTIFKKTGGVTSPPCLLRPWCFGSFFVFNSWIVF